MKIHSKGLSTIAFFAMFIVLFLSFLSKGINIQSPYSVILWCFGGVVILLFSMFFRYPIRKPDINTNAILSAADGKVVAIEKVYEKEYFMEERLVVSVFMSIYDIHVNFIPIEGEILYTKHHPGKNYPAINPKSSIMNEMFSVAIKSDKTSLLVRQIAGIAARRIYLSVKQGDNVNQGDELGLIKLGSRVDIYMPAKSKINVKIGDRVKAAKSVIAWIS